MPDELKIQIFKFLSVREILHCMQVCKNFKTTLCDNHFWKYLFQTAFPEKYLSIVQNIKMAKKQKLDWLDCYKTTLPLHQNIRKGLLFVKKVDVNKVTTKFDNDSICCLIIEGNKIIDLDSGTFRILDFDSGKLIKILVEEHQITSVHAKENRLFVEFADETSKIWDLNSKEDIPLFADKILTKISSDEVKVSGLKDMEIANGKIFCFTYENSIHILKAENSKLLHVCKSEARIESYKITNSHLILGLRNGFVEIWDYHLGESYKKWQTDSGSVDYVECLDEDFLITCSTTTNDDTYVKIWHISSQTLLMEKTLPYKLEHLKTQSGKIIFSFEDGLIQIWDFNKKDYHINDSKFDEIPIETWDFSNLPQAEP